MALTKEQVRVKLNDRSVVILNVLPEEDYHKLHIKGSENLPLGSDPHHFVQKVEDKYGREKTFITYCAGPQCPAGPKAAQILTAHGFKAEDYPGGIEEWHDSFFPVEGTQAHPQPAAVQG